MLHLDGAVGQQGDLLLEGVLVLQLLLVVLRGLRILVLTGLSLIGIVGGLLVGGLGLGGLRLLLRLLLEALVGLLEEGDVVVERLEVDRAVELQVAVVLDRVAQRGAVVQFRASQPGVGGAVGGIGAQPVEERQLVEGQLIGRGERLLIVERRAPVADALLHGVLPGCVTVGIEVFVDGRVGLLYLSMSGTLEVHVEILGEVPSEREVAVPDELLAEGQRQVGILGILEVALLQLVVGARDVGVERDALRQVVESEHFGQRHPLRLALRVLEGLPGLVDGRVGIVERASPLVFVLIDGGLARSVAMRMAVAEREVGGVVRHRVTLVLDAHAGVGEREVARDVLGDGYRLDAVALALAAGRLEGVVELHIRVEGIVAWADGLLRVGIVERRRHLSLIGEELTQLEGGSDAVGLLGIGGALHDGLLESAEAVGDVAARHVDAAHVAQLHVHSSAGRPSALVVGLAQTELVDPHLARLGRGAEVAHTDDERLDLTQRGIAQDGDAVVGLVGVVVAEELRVAGGTLGAGFVAGLLQGGEHLEVDVEHILGRPYEDAVGGHVPVVVAGRRELQGDEILVVVALVVGSQAHKHGQLVVFELGAVGHEIVGVDKHLQVLVLAQVEVGVLVDGLRLVLREVLHGEAEGLLVLLSELLLVGILHAADARRQDVGHRLALGVLLHVDGTHLHRSCLSTRTGLQVLLVLSPLTLHQVETAEAEGDGLLEARQEHTHEADGGEVADAAHLLLPLRQRYAILIPAHGLGLAVAQLGAVVAVVHDVGVVALLPVVVGLQLVVADGYAVLIVALILVEGVVLVDVLDVRTGLIRGVVRLGLVVGRG